MTAPLALVALIAVGWLGACAGTNTDPCVGCPPGFEDMTEGEHRDAACDGIDEIRRAVAGGNLRVTGRQLDEITNHARASGDEALDEAAHDWAEGIVEGDALRVDVAERAIAELCT